MEIRPVSFLEEAMYTFEYLPLFIQISLVITIVAVLSTITAYLVIVARRWNGFVHEQRASYVSPVISDMITEQVLLNQQLAEGKPIDEIQFDEAAINKRQFRKKWVRQILIDTMIQYRKNFGGEIGDLLRKLYMEMGLDKDSFGKMKSVRWDRKIQALLELTKMDVPISDVTILPLTNSKNPQLRVAARNAYIQLSKNEPFKFFDVASEPLLPWDQLEMFRIITTTKDIAIPSFSRWVSYSQNKSIITFCLKLIAHYDQQNAIQSVIQLLYNKDHTLRASAINCLGKLRSEEAEPMLVSIYSNQPLNCQIEILKALGRISSGNHVALLRHEFLYSSNFDVRMAASKSIMKHHNTEEMVEELMNSVQGESLTILKHTRNPLIKH